MKFIILGHGRSGTTVLINTLKQNPDIKMYQEILNYYYAGIDTSIFDFDIPNCTKIPQDTYLKMCDSKYCELAHKKYDGYKILFCHLKNNVAEYLKTVKVILISRRNKLEMQASHEVAVATNKWISTDPFYGTINIDVEKTEKSIKRKIKEEKTAIEDYDPLVVYYEDDMQQNINKISDYLSIPRFDIEFKKEKRIRTSMSSLIQNYSDVAHLDVETFI